MINFTVDGDVRRVQSLGLDRQELVCGRKQPPGHRNRRAQLRVPLKLRKLAPWPENRIPGSSRSRKSNRRQVDQEASEGQREHEAHVHGPREGVGQDEDSNPGASDFDGEATTVEDDDKLCRTEWSCKNNLILCSNRSKILRSNPGSLN